MSKQAHRQTIPTVDPLWHSSFVGHRASVNVLIGGLILAMALALDVSAHDAFYPHHMQDFGMVRSRERVRTTVVISTAIFVLLLAGVIVLAIRKGRVETDELQQDARQALQNAAESAAMAASKVWPQEPMRAVHAVLRAYADRVNVPWDASILPQPEFPVRCRLSGHQLTLSVRRGGEGRALFIQAEHQQLKVALLLDEEGGIQRIE